ncbi:Lysophospholipase, alpha-beta hydrolase superfamily [Williamsia sterculiae]|uniref:Lysophospholipase, alpha-beta hydrolase superfamily n=1 Tax=Williamsia sterculiae TaxID=1344003 RepID=A0A1N7GE91_9NOCA|nr:Lysophospholipase, alpha-beta hydrolase superfamily [Williamsia sterculiae]
MTAPALDEVVEGTEPPAGPAAGTGWQPDILGPDYRSLTIDLGRDPDDEGDIVATLVRHTPTGAEPPPGPAVLYVHGFTDYFFQRPLAEFFDDRGFTFYALDLRKCGRSLREGQTPHYITDLEAYDTELGAALDRVIAETGGPVLVAAHSTGGLITALWLDRLRRTDAERHARISGLALNSPWFDLQGEAYLRSVGTVLVNAVGKVDGTRVVPKELSQAYGESIHRSVHGEWDYDLAFKPLTGFPVTFGFLSAVRHGHARLHRGLDVGVPSLVLRSDATLFTGSYRPEVDRADAVLDVAQIARWSGCVGKRVTVVPIPGARHDVFLSLTEPREAAYRELDRWLSATTRSVGVVDSEGASA